MGRPRDPEKHRYWGAQVRAWRGSGLTQAEFCRRQGLRRRLFCSWKRRLVPTPVAREAQARFVAVAIRPEPEGEQVVPAAPLTVVTATGYRVEVSEGFAPETLARLLTTLGRL